MRLERATRAIPCEPLALELLHQRIAVELIQIDLELTCRHPLSSRPRSICHFSRLLEVRIQLDEFEQVLKQLPPQAYTVFVLHRGLGYSREEIASRLHLSLAMVKKLLAQALVHCRMRFEEME